MVDTVLKVLTKATSIDLLTLDQLKDALGIADTDTSQDEMLATYITQYSDMIATELGRTLAYETMRETVWCLQPRRYYVSHWPVKEDEITSIESPGWPTTGTVYQTTDYMVEEESGKIELFGARDEPIVVTYSGGYNLPDEAPAALQAACTIMIRAAQAMARMQAVSGVRSISHKDARVMFFDPNQALKSMNTPLASAGQSIQSLLAAYRRYWI